ncbi:hypothetical protein METBIDRAFT_31897 [Metschnikowia bicuspidata var. bicuspidata NRRL YB-4993]|uniref:Serine/threonine-protein kinase MEC1 n=1 Tax=Metschnikowia bicuspidata var. bicuspidata NRRL YB-4993 TaxID=869754 RepID=A0A1A0HBG3_9ASCO|nr:hypothetical protein METBIDRAFT_31897 [Metschnikowia bicuspidata var. bicuspidata NRRL YB-4993]OBA21351.1 hypothetical protein METBIDRAFT_31897 [Metschnikowia bicuspidata var. bicuspidata NRRL YB-4993]
MATPFARISSLELDQFLNDVHKNIEHDLEHDELTDFKKLVLCLFRFASAKLSMLQTRPDAEAQGFVSRLFSAIELVFSKRKSLLNIEVLLADISLISADSPSSLTRHNTATLFYEWALGFAMLWLSQFPENLQLTNLIKLFLIELINIVSVRLHGLKHKKNLRSILLSTLETNVNKVYRHVLTDGPSDLHPLAFGPLLSCTVHLFTVLNDFDTSAKLALQTADFKYRFESYAKRLEFVISSSSTMSVPSLSPEASLNLLDTCRSILLLNLSSNIQLDMTTRWSLIELVLKWIHQYFIKLQNSRGGATHSMNQYNRVTCVILMKLFIFCRLRGILLNFFNSFPFSLFEMVESTSHDQLLPIVISRTLHLVHLQSILVMEHAPARFSKAAAPFMDAELDFLRGVVLGADSSHLVKKLQFAIDRPHSFATFIAQSDPRGPADSSSIKSWIAYVVNLIQREMHGPNNDLLHNHATLHSFLSVLRDVPCIISGDFDFSSESCMHCTTFSARNLYGNISIKRKQVSEVSDAMTLYSLVFCEYLLKNNDGRLYEDNLLATNFLLALFNLLATFRLPDRDCKPNHPMIVFVLRCLAKHNNRDVRILAARVVPLFLIREVDQNLESLFKAIFGTLSSIKYSSAQGNIHLAESTMLALSELAITSDGEWLCVIFIKLIQSLGEPNEQHVNLAYNSILYVASAKAMTPYKLLSPYLPSIAEIIIQNAHMFSRLTELLGISKKYFLSNTREYTTPRLMEYYKHDFIQEIAEASNMTKVKLISKMLPRIIATYLCKDDHNDAKYIVSVLSNVSPSYRSMRILELVSNVGAVLWAILLQMQMDEDGVLKNETKIVRAITFIAKIHWSKKPENNSSGSPPDEGLFDYVSYILQDYILELAQKFSEVVHQTKGIKPYMEKVNSIRAMQFIISRNIEAATWALGQISTCLQAAMDFSSLEVYALLCWNVLVQRLDSPKLVSLFDISISLIFQKFESFPLRSKSIAAEILKRLYREITEKYNNYGPYYYSYSFTRGLDKFYAPDASSSAMLKLKNRVRLFPELTRRLQTNNRIVVHQALDDLINLSKAYQQKWQSETLRESSSENEISKMVRTVLDLSVQFKSRDPDLSTKCAIVLASLGSLDSSRFNFKTINSQIIVLYDFQDYEENSTFLVDFIQNKVIKNFWALNDPTRQLFSVYSMQSFLRILRLEPSILEGESQGIRSEVWHRFSEIDRSTLTPLLSSMYFASPPRYEPIEFPHYRLGMRYEKWLVDLSTNLFRRPIASTATQKGKPNANPTKNFIFQTCSMLIRDDEISISLYLLKYVVLSHIASGDEQARNDILSEFLCVLKTDSSSNVGSDRTENLKLCYQRIFEVLDYFNEWVSAATERMSDSSLPKVDYLMLKSCRSQVSSFLEEIPTQLIALTSSQCDSYERTILYLEKCYRKEKDDTRDAFDKLNIASTLQSVYANIEDYDALNGVLRKFSTRNLAEKLDAFQYNENWYLAQESFQVLSSIGSEDVRVNCNTRLLKSYTNHALYDKVLSSLESQIGNESITRLPIAWTMVGLQAALESGEINEITRWYNAVATIGMPQDVEDVATLEYASGLLSLAKQDEKKFTLSIQSIYATIGQSLSLSMSLSFSRNTNLLRQLHILFDSSLIVSAGNADAIILQEDLILTLRERMRNTDLEFSTQWKILLMHKLLFEVTNNKDQISSVYLVSAEIARRNKRLDIATRSIVKAMALNDEEASIEYAHLLWEQGKQTEAIKTLSENLECANSKTKARRQLQYALWLDESSHSSSATIIEEYTKAYRLDNTWEKPFFDIGKYYSKVMESQNDRSGYYEKQIIRFYLHALKLGTTYIFEALPKLITVWLDFAQRQSRNRDAIKRLETISQELLEQKDGIPMYVWFTCVTQILSRLSHSHEPSVKVMMQIISTLISTYPKHTLWYTLSHVKSKDEVRSKRVSSILVALCRNPGLGENIRNAQVLFDILENLASVKTPSKSGSKKRQWLLSEDFNVRDTHKPHTALVIPVKSNLEIRIPAASSSPGSRAVWNAFPKSASVTFDGFDDKVNVFQSLQKPKQITVRGSDNLPYRLMLKMDDTRKDAKVFEFTNMINRLLTSNADARKRNLTIENYSVIPLAEDKGVIEFVQGVSTMKSVINAQQKKAGFSHDDSRIFRKLAEAQKIAKARNSSEPNVDENLVIFFRTLCKEVKPVLHQWFIDQFSDPAVWYLARNCFTRTSAVMSIVGYIIGLGDRHCENILFLKKNGAALHIDFDCLFEKGRTLPTPEVVPFRLTQNLVDAMGITGVEGAFRKTCEVTGALVRENEASLMNILETLIYDPLLDWKTLENPQEHLKKVRRKIRGLLEREGLPMNIHGQVDYLIQQASSEQNLCRMYGGWGAYI